MHKDSLRITHITCNRTIGEFPTIIAKGRVNRMLAKQMMHLEPLRQVLLKIAAGGDEENQEAGGDDYLYWMQYLSLASSYPLVALFT